MMRIWHVASNNWTAEEMNMVTRIKPAASGHNKINNNWRSCAKAAP